MKSLIVYNPAPMNLLAMTAITDMCKGLKRIGVPFTRKDIGVYEPSELAVVVGWLKKILNVKGGRAEIINEQRNNGRDLLILERAWLKDRDGYHALTWNGFGGHGQRLSENCPSDRWEKLELEFEPWRTEGKHILLCAQVPWDAQVDGSKKDPLAEGVPIGDHVGWISKTIRRIRERTDRPIVLRFHPKVVRMGIRKHFPIDKLKDMVDRISEPKSTRATQLSKHDHQQIRSSLHKDLKNCWAMVAYNSNSGVDAVLKGIPVFLSEKCGRSYPFANKDLDDINDPVMPDRRQWAQNLAYDQWNNAELTSGEAWCHIARGTKWMP